MFNYLKVVEIWALRLKSDFLGTLGAELGL